MSSITAGRRDDNVIAEKVHILSEQDTSDGDSDINWTYRTILFG